LKIFEAMAAGKAVVSTSLGAEGLPVVHGVHVLLADDAATFAEHTARLLREPAERNRLSSSGRALVESQFGWEAVAARFEDSLYGVLRSRT
jgi:glycosyltransferase involved in cell wall biosynthesis